MGIKFERVKDVFSICSDKIKVEFSEPQIQAHDDYGYCKNENGILYYYYGVDIYTKLNKKWKKMLEIDTYDFPNLINFKKILDEFVSKDIKIDNYQKNAYNDELVVQYEGPKEEPIPPKVDLGDFCPIKFSPFDYFCLPERKLSAERREYEMSFRNLPYQYGNT